MRLHLASFFSRSVGLTSLASTTSDMAAMTKIDISKNNIGADGAKALADVIPASKVQTLVIGDGVEISTRGSEAETLDFSNKGFGPGEVVLISALVIPFSPTS